jgi:hypothetical protein
MSEQSQPEAEPAATEAEAPEGAAPALSHDPILGDVRTDVVTVGPGGDVPIPVEEPAEEPAEEEKAEGEAEAEA